MGASKDSCSVYDDWIKLKKEAKESRNFDYYEWFLNEFQKEMIRLYAKVKKLDVVKLVEGYLSLISKEKRWIVKQKIDDEIPF